MPLSPVERIQALLFEDGVNPHALLLDLVSLIPESMLEWAARCANHARSDRLRDLLTDALAKRRSGKITELTDVTTPEGKDAREWIAQLSDDDRDAVFAVLLSAAEPRMGMVEAPGPTRFPESGADDEDDDDDGFESVAPAGREETKYVEDDSGFESAAPERPDVVNLGFSQKHAADTKLQKQEPLQRGHSYYFWLRIGKDVDEAAIGTCTSSGISS